MSVTGVGAVELPVSVGVDPGHDLAIGGSPEVEGQPPVHGEVIFHILAASCVLPAGSGFDVRSSELPCLDLFWAEDVSVDLLECVPLIVRPLPVEGVRVLAMIEARKGFLDPSASGVGASLSLSSSIGLCGAVTGVGLVWPLSKWDWRLVAPSRGREGYVVSLKSGERVGAAVGGRVVLSPRPWSGQCRPGDVGRRGIDVFVLDVDVVGGEDGVGGLLLVLRESSLSISCVPGACGVFGVVMGVRRCSIAPWVCCLCTPYVPRRGAWVLKPGCWGVMFMVELPGIVVGRELLPTRVVLVGGGIPNCDRSPVKGTGGGGRANRCQIHADGWSSPLEAGDDIVDWEWCGSPVSPWDSPSAEEYKSLQLPADLLSIYE